MNFEMYGEFVEMDIEDEQCEEDWDDEYEDYEPDYDEIGYNPYMGCYDWDC